MSKFNYDDAPAPKKRAKLEIWDVLSIATLFLTVCLVVYFAAIFFLPDSALNPLPPNGAGANAITPTPTIGEIPVQATWTGTPLPPEPTETATLLPTFTLEPTQTPFSLLPPTKTPTITATPKAPFKGTFKGIDSTIIHPELGCNWQGVGGTVVDANNADILRMTIRLVGTYKGKSINELTVSSIAPAYGKSGFEFSLGDSPVTSKGELYLQLLDQAGLPLSDNLYIDLSKDCSKNLVLVRFVKNP